MIKSSVKRVFKSLLFVLIFLILIYQDEIIDYFNKEDKVIYDVSNIPDYSNEDFILINDNKPIFEGIEEIKTFEEYGELDSLGRATYAYALLGKDLMPTEEREDISSIKPTGYQKRYIS